eukprot:gene25041-31451_t
MNNHTLVFFDKTQSVNVDDAFVRTKYQSALKALIDQNIQTEGDVFEIYYIHENTAKAKVLSLSARTTKESSEGLNATDLEAAQTNYDMSIGKERRMILDLAVQKMLEKNAGAHDQAEEWAKADAENYKLYNLTNAQISIILPFSPNSSSKENNPNVTDYWKVYFETLGVSGVKEI